MNLDRSLARAKKVEDALRERAILPVNTEINGIEVKQFNLEHWLILSEVKSSFLMARGIPSAVDIGLFMWVVSPEYDPRSFGSAFGFSAKVRRYFASRKRRAFLKRIVRQPRWINFEPRIRKYLNRAFMDRPPTGEGGKQISAGLGASMIHRIAYAYHWPREAIIRLPVAEVFQYLNWLGANQPQFNPKQTATINRFYESEDRKKLNGVENGR